MNTPGQVSPGVPGEACSSTEPAWRIGLPFRDHSTQLRAELLDRSQVRDQLLAIGIGKLNRKMLSRQHSAHTLLRDLVALGTEELTHTFQIIDDPRHDNVVVGAGTRKVGVALLEFSYIHNGNLSQYGQVLIPHMSGNGVSPVILIGE